MSPHNFQLQINSIVTSGLLCVFFSVWAAGLETPPSPIQRATVPLQQLNTPITIPATPIEFLPVPVTTNRQHVPRQTAPQITSPAIIDFDGTTFSSFPSYYYGFKNGYPGKRSFMHCTLAIFHNLINPRIFSSFLFIVDFVVLGF